MFSWMRIYSLISFCITAYIWVIIIRALISWFSPNLQNPFVHFLFRITEPVLGKVRKLISFSTIGNLDLAPLFLLVFLWILDWALFKFFVQFFYRLPF